MTDLTPQLCAKDFAAWKRGDTATFCGFTIQPKRDFGTDRSQVQPGCDQPHGWVVIKNGCLATPGGCWAHSMDGAKRLVDAMVAAGLGEHGHRDARDAEGGARFWALLNLTRELGPDWRISEAMRMRRADAFNGRFGGAAT